jgi:nitrite reductase/ring-hydroxylating ferredoxin subunit
LAEFRVALQVSELQSGEQKQIDIEGDSILLSNVDGEFYAIGNICTHAGCPLSGGLLKGKVITCLCHGSQFDVTTGELLRGQADEPEPIYEVKIEGDDILIGGKKDDSQ